MALKYFVEAGAINIRRLPRRAASALLVVWCPLSDMEEALDQRQLVMRGRGAWAMASSCTLKGKTKAACTIVLRGANEFMLDEMDRSVHDSLCVVKLMLESNTLTVGGGPLRQPCPFTWKASLRLLEAASS